MKGAPVPTDEEARLRALQAAHILDTPPEAVFDDLVALAAAVCGTPIALVSLVDRERQWFKARVGLAAAETPRAVAFCAHAILGRDVFVVPDALTDDRFADNPLVVSDPRIRFYAGTPLIGDGGHALGTLCVIDRVPRTLDAHQLETLRALGRVVSTLVAQRLHAAKQRAAEQKLNLSHVAARIAEAALREANAEIDSFFAFSLGLLCIADFDGRFRRLNPAFERILGYSLDELVNRPFLEFVHPDDRAGTAAAAAALGAGGLITTFENRYRCKDGTYRWFRWSAAPLTERGLIFAMANDITEVKRTADELATRTHLAELGRDVGVALARPGSVREAVQSCAEAMVQHLGVAFARIWLLDTAERVLVLEASAGLYTHLDGPHGRVPVGKFKIGLIAEERCPYLTNAVLEDPRVGDREWARREGMVAFAGHPLIVEGELLGVVAMFAREPLDEVVSRALTAAADAIASGIKRKQAAEAELQLRDALRQRNVELEEQTRMANAASRLKSEFLANMSHELRTPLNGIIGFSHLLYEGEVGPISAEQREFVGDIRKSGRHLLQLINDILDLSKVEAGKLEFRPEAVDLTRVVDEVRDIVRSIAAATRIRVLVEVDPAVGPIVLDPARLKQVLYNYLSNALKFTPDEGRVTVSVVREGDDAFRLEVEDTGIGIGADDLARLFVEFQQLDAGSAKQHQGTGLGLALTKKIVEAQGGRVGVRSTVGKGSAFFAVLPRGSTAAISPAARSDAAVVVPAPVARAGLEAALAAAGMAPVKLAVGGPAPSILVVEDDPKEAAWLRRALGEAGYHVELAATGAEALALLHDRPFSAVTLDLFLPDMTGWDILREVRAGGPNREVPVIVVTVVSDKSTAVGFKIHDFLHKPAAPEDLLAALMRAGLSPGGGRPVLIVDDDPTARKTAAFALEGHGYRAVLAAEGESGLRAAEEEPPAAVILDLNMPGVDGFEFLRRFRRTPAGARTPVIIWSAKDLTADERVRLQASAQAVVLKGAGSTSALLDEINLQVKEVTWRANQS